MRLPLQRDCGLTVIAELQLCDAPSTRSLDLQQHDPHTAPGRAGHAASQMEFNSSETREDPPVRGGSSSFRFGVSLLALPRLICPARVAFITTQKSASSSDYSQSRIAIMSALHTETHVQAKDFEKKAPSLEVTCANVWVLDGPVLLT
jgi:hypothetical protein